MDIQIVYYGDSAIVEVCPDADVTALAQAAQAHFELEKGNFDLLFGEDRLDGNKPLSEIEWESAPCVEVWPSAKIRLETERGIVGRYEDNVLAACQKGDSELLKVLLAAGISSGKIARGDILTTKSLTAMTLAAESGHIACLRLLLASGARPDDNAEVLRRESDLRGCWSKGTPLMAAAFEGHDEVVQMLLDAGANPDLSIRSDGFTPMMCAAFHGHFRCMQYLHTAGAAVLASDKAGKNALHHASMQGHTECVEALLSWGLPVDSAMYSNETSMAWACRRGHTDVVSLLIRRGAAVPANSLFVAATNGHLSTCEVLFPECAAGSVDHFADGTTALILSSKRGKVAVVEWLLKHDANADHADSSPQTALGWAVHRKKHDCAELLRKANARLTPIVPKKPTPVVPKKTAEKQSSAPVQPAEPPAEPHPKQTKGAPQKSCKKKAWGFGLFSKWQ